MAINKITVIGGGLMGRGIAHVAAMGGFEVILNDIKQEFVDKAYDVIQTNISEGVKRGKATLEQMDEALDRITLSTDIKEAVSQADFIIEAVPEDIRIKADVFQKLEEYTDENVILASNTSSMSVTEIAGSISCQHRVVGMHFFNPAFKMKLVEIIRGLETGDEAVEVSKQVAEQMGKQTVVINDAPGFSTSRISALIGNEAMYMLQEGVATAEDIDKALKLGLNFPMGPLELGDLVGLDTRLKILEYLHKHLGEKFRPCPLFYQYVKAGRLGRKAGKGIYDYTQK